MLLLVLFEYAFFVGIAVLVVTQIFAPLFRGTPLFPLFGTEAKLESELTRARGDLRVAQLKKDIKDVRESAEVVDPAPNSGQNIGR